MPYARLLQEARIASETQMTTYRNEWIQSAFVGWQVVGALGGKTGSFQKYMKKLGIRDPAQTLSREQVETEKRQAFQALELVERTFDGGTP